MSKRMSALVEQAYAAALDDSLWERWSQDIVSGVNGIGASLVVLGSSKQPVERMIEIGWADKLIEEYHQHWWQYDPQVPKVASITRSALYCSDDYVDESDPTVSDYCQWQRAKSGFDHHIGIVAMLDGDRKGGISIHRRVDAGSMNTIADELTAILPDIVRAFRLGFQHQAMLANGFWDGLAARSAGEAMLLIDERGAVMRATDAALAILASDEGLGVTQNRLRAATPSEDATLSAIIGRAIALVAPVSGATRVQRRSGKRPYIVIAYPLVRRRRMLAPLEAAALIRIVDPSRRATGSAALLRGAFGFTPRESELALLLVADHSVESAAAVMGIAVPTARVHLAKVLAKTGTGRQGECIAMLTRLT